MDCAICKVAKQHNKVPANYECAKNYKGPSKSMEGEAILQLTIEFWDEKNTSIGTIVADNDTTMKLRLTHFWKELCNSGILKKSDWSKTKNN